MKMKNIKVLQISATPSNSLIDGENWENYHGKICPRMNSQYVSFERFLYEDRVKETKYLEDNEECQEYLQEIKHGRGGLGQHYGPKGRCSYKDILFILIEKVEEGAKTKLARREQYWQHQLRAFVENGGNAHCIKKEII